MGKLGRGQQKPPPQAATGMRPHRARRQLRAMDATKSGGTGITALLGAMDQPEDELLARVRAILVPKGFAVEVVDYAAFGLAGEPDDAPCHALIADHAGRAAAEGWGPTPRL